MFVKKIREKIFHDEVIITIHFFNQALRVIINYIFVKKNREKRITCSREKFDKKT